MSTERKIEIQREIDILVIKSEYLSRLKRKMLYKKIKIILLLTFIILLIIFIMIFGICGFNFNHCK